MVKSLIKKSILFFVFLFLMIHTSFGQDLFDIKAVRTIKVTIKEKNWEHVLDSFKNKNIDKKIEANCTIDGKKYEKIGISYKGNSSYFNVKNTGSRKLPFHLKSTQSDKKQLFFNKYKSIKLSNVFRDPSFIREVLSYNIARSYLFAAECNFANLYINNEFFGLYNCTQSIDEQFLEESFGTSTGTFIKCDPDWQLTDPKGCPANEKASLYYNTSDSNCLKNLYELQSESGYANLLKLMNALQKGGDTLNKFLNIDETLWYLAFNNVLVNLDSYSGKLSHNYYLYQDTFGIFHPIVWDLNLSFGGFRHDGFQNSALNLEQMQTLSPLLHYQNPLRPLISSMMKNEQYKKQYLAHIRTILKDFFETEQYMTIANDIRKNIDNFVKKDTLSLYPYESFQQNIEKSAKAGSVVMVGIRELMLARSKYLLAHPLINVDFPNIKNVTHSLVNGEVSFEIEVEKSNEMILYYRYENYAPFQQMVLKDDGKNGDLTENDGKINLKLPYSSAIFHYYLCAFNEKSAAFFPEKAAKTYISIK